MGLECRHESIASTLIIELSSGAVKEDEMVEDTMPSTCFRSTSFICVMFSKNESISMDRISSAPIESTNS